MGALFIARLGDTVGRIKMIRISLVTTTIIFGLLFSYPKSMILTYILIFLSGFFSTIRTNVGLLYGLETIREKYKNTVGSLYNVFDGVTMLIFAIYFVAISN